MYTKYLILTFENAGIIKRKLNKKGEPDFKTVINNKWIRHNFFEENRFDTLTSHDILNVLLGLTRGVPVSRDPKKMTERVKLSVNKELIKYSKDSYVKVISGIMENGEPIFEMMSSEKVEEQSEKEQTLTWSSMKIELRDSFHVFCDFFGRYGITQTTHTMPKAFDWLFDNYAKIKDEFEQTGLLKKSNLLKTSLDSGRFNTKHFGFTGRPFTTKCMHNRGVDSINIRSGEIYVPCDEYLEELLKKGKTCTKLLDGGIVYLSSITTVNISKIAENSENIKKVVEKGLAI